MKVLKNAVAALALLAMIGGCSAWGQRGYVEVSERSANYTEMYIDYVIYDPNDKSVGLSVVVIGSSPVSSDSYNYLIMRFFPGQQIEVELVSKASEDVGNGPPSPRLDQLFYGRQVMRHMGE